jgi:hypothetical protein
MNIIELLCVGLIFLWAGTQLEKHNTEAASQADFNLGFDYANQLCGEVE